MAAVVSGDRRMTQLFFEGADIHMNTAVSITGKKPEDISKEERKKAKSCFTGETEILTSNGWCRLDSYDGSDVAQYDINTGEISFEQPLQYGRVYSKYNCTFENEHLSLDMTQNHNVILVKRNGEVVKDEAINLNGFRGSCINAGKYIIEFKLNELETRFLAALVNDGCLKERRGGRITFHFHKERKYKRLLDLLNNLGYNYKDQSKDNDYRITIDDFDNTKKYLRYTNRNKELSWNCIHEIDGRLYLQECGYWDGTFQGKGITISTTKEKTANVMQALGALNNLRVSLTKRTRVMYNRVVIDWVLCYKQEGTYTESTVNRFDLKLSKGSKYMYCVQTNKGNIVIRHHNKVSIQGNCNFGFLYGMMSKKFMIYARDNYGTVVNEKEAKAFRNSFFDEYSDLLPWHDKQRRLARAEGEVRNPIGRIRHLPGIYSLEKSKQAEAERQAINSPVQGFGSDVAISAIVELVNTVPEEIGYLVGSVHDSIECLVKTEYVEWFSKYVLKTMSNPRILKEIFQFETKVPIIADLEVGPFGLGVELEEWMKTNKVPQKEGWLIDWNPKNILPPRYKKKK